MKGEEVEWAEEVDLCAPLLVNRCWGGDSVVSE